MNRFFLCLIVCFSFNIAKAQLKDTFEKGIIITNENVKMDGYIKTNDLSHLSTEISFKLTEEDVKYINYNTTQIKSFQTETGKIFDLLAIKINNNSKEIAVFASLILKGQTSLYKTIYKSTTFYIVVTKDENYVLQNDEIITGETNIKKYNYEGVLNIATEGFLVNNYQKIAFNELDFIKIISEFNTSNKTSIALRKQDFPALLRPISAKIFVISPTSSTFLIERKFLIDSFVIFIAPS